MTLSAPARSEARPRVVVVGAGFGGLEVVHALRHAPVRVTLIDRQNHHLFQPLLYQVATAALSPAEVAWPIRHLFRKQANARVILAEAVGVDVEERRVDTSVGAFPYDRLVLAPGSTPFYFGHDDWARTAPGLKTLDEAVAIREHILTAFERAETETNLGRLSRLLTFVIIGGGPTGVELAGAISELARETLRDEFNRLNPEASRVVLLEAGPRLLPSFPEHLSEYAARALAAMGVEVRVSTPVLDCDPDGVTTSAGRIDAATVLWGAGVRTSSLVKSLRAPTDKTGRVRVGPDLSVEGRPEVFVIGDAAAADDGHGQDRTAPALAPAAKQMGRHVGRLIAAEARGSAERRPFRYMHEGDLATVGRNRAAVRLSDRFELTGFVGWVFWSIVHVLFLIGVRNRVAVAGDWVWGYLSRRRAARLIVGRVAEPGAAWAGGQPAEAAEERGWFEPPPSRPQGEPRPFA
jgi:NADH dehydrogenase